MQRYILATFFVATWLACEPNDCRAAEPLTVVADFEGASVEVLRIDQAARSVQFAPGGDPARGWPCWWYFRLDGITPGETITLRLQASSATVGKQKPLAASWAMPTQATFSTDGETWLHSDDGKRTDQSMVYSLQTDATSVYVAWGPPYTPHMAAEFVREIGDHSPYAKATELCRSRGGRGVPMLHVREGDRDNRERFGVWVQARQHAWESGSSWVAQGFAEWVTSDDAEAAWLRQHAEIFIVPIMDIDNTATGNGGKNALPHDHNRDWSAEPHWNEILAAQRRIRGLVDEGRISKIKPLIPMSNKPKVTGASYHPLWRQISSNWVSMNGNPHTVSLCLETIWNYKNSTPTGYRAVGANLAAAVQEYLTERPAKP